MDPAQGEALEVDLLVLGGGMAGMTAAARAARAGKRVLVAEKGPELGGSAVLSGGKLWTARSMELMAQETPGGDPALCQAVFDGFEGALAWLRETGVAVADVSHHLHYGRGFDFDVVGYIDACRQSVEQAGGWIVRSAETERLLVDGGRVSGALIRDRDGASRVHAPWVLLATGGFAANPTLLARFVHRQGDRALARANPHNSGDGLRLGLAVGGSISRSMKGFYGHVMQFPVHRWGPREFRAYTQGGSIKGLLINQRGERFCDESLGDHQNAQRILEQPSATALVVFDEAVRRAEARTVLAGTSTPIDKVQIAIDEGAHVAVADNWGTLFARTRAWGFDADRAQATVAAYNRAAADGSDLPVGRARDRVAYLEPPFYAVQGQAGVTATHGGLRVDTEARVLDAHGRPIPGLLTAGADAGNPYGGGYAGGLAFAAVFGLKAAQHVIDG